MKQTFSLAGYLAVKEVQRNRGRFLLVSLVIALITLLVLFIAALGEGLGNGNREYISKLDAQLIVFQDKSDFSIQGSRLARNRVTTIRRIDGVEDAGMLAAASAKVILPGNDEVLGVSLLGVEPGHIGEPKIIEGRQLGGSQAEEVIIDRSAALRSGLVVGDTLTIRVTQGTEDEFFDLRVVGLTDGQQYSLQPSIFLPFYTWDKVRPKSEAELRNSNPVPNIVIVKLSDPMQTDEMRQVIASRVQNVETADLNETILALPGYTAQQSTLNTQGGFTLFIGILVIGGFFQIQVLQKVPQIGVLKAIGASNPVVAISSVFQIMLVTAIGVLIGGLLSYLFSLTFPPTVPIVFNGQNSATAIIALLLIGPFGGLVSIRYATRIEPLKALGLSS